MSYDLTFWRRAAGSKCSALELYRAFCRSSPPPVGELEQLPVQEILAKLSRAFPEFDPVEPPPFVGFYGTGIEVTWSPYRFRFDFRGLRISPAVEKIISLMREFDCTVWDTQLDEEFSL